MIRAIEVPARITLGQTSRVGMLFIHPHLQFDTAAPIISLTSECRAKVEKTVRDSLIIAKDQPATGCTQNHYVLIPELGLPRTMLEEVEQALEQEDWPRNTVVISGVEHTAFGTFRQILVASNNPPEAKQINAGPATYANFCVIWTKDSDGQVNRFVQAKLKPSRPEQATQGMYEGEFVLLFHTDLLSFVCLICFDFLAEDAGQPILDSVLSQIGAKAEPGRATKLDLFFVPQCNPYPEHPEFLESAYTALFNAHVPTADSSVAFVNSAHTTHGRAWKQDHGRSAIYYRRGRWEPIGDKGPLLEVPRTFAQETPPLQRKLLRARFREDGPCVHRFAYVIPSLTGGAARAPKYPLAGAHRHRIEDDGSLLRGPGDQVAALRKVVLDWITHDLVDRDNRLKSTDVAFQATVSELYARVRKQIEDAEDGRIGEITDLLFLGFSPQGTRPDVNPDSWQKDPEEWHKDDHGEALIELVSTTVALKLLAECTLLLDHKSHTGQLGKAYFAVLDGYGKQTHTSLLRDYFNWTRKSAWVETVGKSNLIVVTRIESGSPKNDIAEDVSDSYFRISSQDEAKLPVPLQTRAGDILKEPTKWHWHTATSLRAAIKCGTMLEAQAQLRGKLGPVAIAG